MPVKFLLNDPEAPGNLSARDGEERNIVFLFFVLIVFYVVMCRGIPAYTHCMLLLHLHEG